MRFRLSLFLLSFASIIKNASAKVVLMNPTFSGITIGEPFTIKWAEAGGPVTLSLMGGQSFNLFKIETLISGADSIGGSGSFVWTPGSTLSLSETYALQIDDGSTTNFGTQFKLNAGTSQISSVASTAENSPSPTPTTLPTVEAPPTPTPTPTPTLASSVPTSSSSSSEATLSSQDTTSRTSPTSSLAHSSTSTVPSSLTTNISSPTSSPTSTPQTRSSGLSTGAKAGIGIGVTILVFLIIGGIWFAFWWGKRSASKQKNDDNERTFGKAELGADNTRSEMESEKPIPIVAEIGEGEPLTDEEKKELDRRRRAAELEGGDNVHPVEMGDGKLTERAELEARRKLARELFEMG